MPSVFSLDDIGDRKQAVFDERQELRDQIRALDRQEALREKCQLALIKNDDTLNTELNELNEAQVSLLQQQLNAVAQAGRHGKPAGVSQAVQVSVITPKMCAGVAYGTPPMSSAGIMQVPPLPPPHPKKKKVLAIMDPESKQVIKETVVVLTTDNSGRESVVYQRINVAAQQLFKTSVPSRPPTEELQPAATAPVEAPVEASATALEVVLNP